jgi:hypothetical protein
MKQRSSTNQGPAKSTALAQIKPCPQASALTLVQPSAALRPLRGRSKDGRAALGLILATPDLAGQARVQQLTAPRL